jgi:hypothetical protein
MSATASSAAPPVDPQRVALYTRVLGGNLGLAQVWFDERVLDDYRAQSGARVMRTNTVGRVRSAAGWSLDFGIAEREGLIHATLTDLSQRLPASERQHWTQHLVTPAASRTFLSMRLAPGSCIDDGELREWPAATDKEGSS